MKMEKLKREIDVGEESDDMVNHGSVPALTLQPWKVLSVARWVCEMGMAEVETPRGSIWTTTGIVRGGKLYCFIEEVLFLSEQRALRLMDDVGASLSHEDVLLKLSDTRNGSCWDYFQAYRLLKSLGYIVGRHGIPWSLKSDSDNSENSSISSLEDEIITSMFSQMKIKEARPVFYVYPPSSTFRKSCPCDPSYVVCFARYPPSKATIEQLRKECGVPLKFCHVELSDVSFFSFDDTELPVLP